MTGAGEEIGAGVHGAETDSPPQPDAAASIEVGPQAAHLILRLPENCDPPRWTARPGLGEGFPAVAY